MSEPRTAPATVTGCTARFRTYDPDQRAVTVGCQLEEGHDGSHRCGHWQDVMWSWTDDSEDRW